MAVGFDQIDSAEATSGTTIAVTGFAPGGADRLIVAQAGSSSADSLSDINKNSVDFGDEQWALQIGGYWRFHQRSLTNPTTASESVTANWPSGNNSDGLGLGVFSFTGVDQSTPLDTPVTSTGNSNDPAGLSITSETGDMVVGGIWCAWNTNATFQGDGTERYNFAGIGSYDNGAGSTAVGAASVNVEWGGGTGYGNDFAMGGVNINAAAAGAADPMPPLWQSKHNQIVLLRM